MLMVREASGSILKGVGRGCIGLFLVAALAACSWSNENAGSEIEFTKGTFTETLIEAQITSQFAEIYSSVLPSLSPDQIGGKTLFAPTNAAMEKFLGETSETLEGVIAKPELALGLVLNHLLGQEISTTEMLNMSGKTLTMLSGITPSINSSGGSVRIVGGAESTSTLIAIDLESSDGIVHIVDAVIQP
jgi:uncharacterized surface protein with fasciclin (FAS1) repeats